MLLSRLIGPAPVALNPFDDRYWSDAAATSASGVQVTDQVALQVSAFFACVAVLAETMAMLPFVTLRKTGNQRVRAEDHRLYPLLHDQANAEQTAFDWREWMTAVAVMRGRAISRIMPGRTGFAEALVPLHPDHVRSEKLPTGRERFVVQEPGKPQEILVRDEVFILRGRLGLSIVELARETIGIGTTSQRYLARQRANGVRPSGVVQGERAMSDGAWSRFRDSFNENYSGPHNAGKVVLLEEGFKWQQIGLTNVDAQFIETEQFTIAQIARFFRMQAHKIGDLTNATFSNIEHQGIEFVTDTIMPWALRWEMATARDLLLDSDRERGIYVKIMLQALLRGDSAARGAFYATGIKLGFFTRNEVREWEELNPLPGLDEPLDPRTMPGSGKGGKSGAEGIAATSGRAGVFATDAAARVIRREVAGLTKAAERAGNDFGEWARARADFYAGHRAFLASALHISEGAAEAYCRAHDEELAEAGLRAMGAWEARDTPGLAALALGEPVARQSLPQRTTKRVERDSHGRISAVIEEVVSG